MMTAILFRILGLLLKFFIDKNDFLIFISIFFAFDFNQSHSYFYRKFCPALPICESFDIKKLNICTCLSFFIVRANFR